MFPTSKAASVAVLLLSVAVRQSHASLRNGGDNEIKRKKVEDGKKRALFEDDEGFWTRYVDGASNSIPTPAPTIPLTCAGSVSYSAVYCRSRSV